MPINSCSCLESLHYLISLTDVALPVILRQVLHLRIKASDVKDTGTDLADQHVAQPVADPAVVLQGRRALGRDVFPDSVRCQELKNSALNYTR
jgi:hypothetical protein